MELKRKVRLILIFIWIFFLDGLLIMADHSIHSNYTFVVEEKTFRRLCTTKKMLTVNGMFPGPTIRVRKGQTAFITVHNKGNYGITIHWHGVKQPRNPWSDGPENITQCPIQPGKSFTYEVIFSTEEGTLWWHAHSDWSRATVHGPIIILPPLGKTYPFPQPHAQKTVVLASWFNGDVNEIIESALATGSDPNISDAFTINGWPGPLYNCTNETIYNLVVRPKRRYLLRVVNAVMNEEMFLAIAQHNLTVVAQDAAYIKPITTDYIMIAPGQTMDILLTTKNHSKPTLYYIFSRPFSDSNVSIDNSTTSAILRYHYGDSKNISNKTIEPSSSNVPIMPILLPNITDRVASYNFTSRIRALATKEFPVNVPTNVGQRLFITVSINTIICPNSSCEGPDGNRIAASLNNVSFQTPSIDILQAYYRSLSGVYSSDFPARPPYIFNFTGDVGNNTLHPSIGTKVKMVEYGEAIEIIFQGTNVLAAENHPMHLHGFSVYNVGNGYGNFDHKTSPKTYNLLDPPELNTFGVPKNGWVAVRFFAQNPGVWFLHCHLERHVSWGMSAVLIVKNGPTKETSIREPPPNMPICS
ncbi:laccase-14-like [Humulus lupulus]|uniref:laccase-14-like n=1 Tax=Humulus lupulus TaxID=3486 RepID=UPI002B41514B|nr:laccase-14-like [Humulus lupulus]